VTVPLDLAVWHHRFAEVAEEIGAALGASALSPNIKERRDYSAAVFDAAGDLVAQAAHIPVHLGAAPLGVQAVLKKVRLSPGDHAIANDPFEGGTHLPDISIVTPVYLPGEDSPRFYVATRAHHADVGGETPGSMPLSTHIDQEGVRISPTLLTDDVRAELLGRARGAAERAADLGAQIAANEVGAARLRALARDPACVDRMAALRRYAASRMRAVLSTIPSGVHRFVDVLDDDGAGTRDVRIAVAIERRGDEVLVDFTGSAPQVPGCLNATEAITVSAVLYVLRCLAPADLPTNAGCMDPIRVVLPERSVVNAAAPAAVAGGNVETSQRIVDVLLGALAGALPDRIPAASQGTMNNVAFGGADWAYYETIGGGAGAAPGAAGLSGVHTHMTNTRNTPIEALSREMPVDVVAYRLRRGSGGAGRFPGGEGIVRRYRFRRAATLTILSERRVHAPWGLAGGGPGATGMNLLRRAGGPQEELPGKCVLEVGVGDEVEIQTPGGGGFGAG